MSNISKKFKIYHKNNPHVYILFRKYAFRVYNKGFKHYSARAIFHRIRWHLDVETKDSEGFKINNNYSSRYARMLERRNPKFKGFFRNRTLRTKE